MLYLFDKDWITRIKNMPFLLRILIVFLSFWTISAFAYRNQTISGNFHRIVISGNIKSVRLHQTRGTPYMVINGDQADIQDNEFYIQDDWLKAHVGEGYPKFGEISLDIWVNNIHTINIKGNIPVQGLNLYTSGLAVNTMGSPEVHLNGHIVLNHVRIGERTQLMVEGINTKNLSLQMRGASFAKLQGNIDIGRLDIRDQSCLNMHWISTYHLKFTLAGSTNVQLAGQVQVLDLEMYDHAQFGGRYLRANRAFVKTNGFSEAQISAVRSQHTYSLDQSHIDYFNVPLMKTDLMVLSGETLDLREWSQRFAVNDDTFGD
jgi:hypothetical protein